MGMGVAVPVSVSTDGAGRGDRSRGRMPIRGRAAARTARMRPVAVDELQLEDIELLPIGAPLERPLQNKRRRTCSPTREELAQQDLNQLDNLIGPVPVLVQQTEPTNWEPSTSTIEVDIVVGRDPPPPGTCTNSGDSASPASQGISAPPFPSSSRHSLPLRDDSISEELYWSEPDSDESSGDEHDTSDHLPAFVSRVIHSQYRSRYDGPEEGVGDEVNVGAEVEVEAGEGLAEYLVAGAAVVAEGAGNAVQPSGFYDFQWTAFPTSPITPESRREWFDHSNVGPMPAARNADPYATFISIWDQHIMEHIASETNRYAQALASYMMTSHTLCPSSRINEWQDTSADELYVYFALLLGMGMVSKSSLEEYWSTDVKSISWTPGFRARMSLRRFQSISRCIHFNDNQGMRGLNLEPSEAKLYKIKPILTHLCQKFESMYMLSQNIALDESLLQWKGCLDINQRIPNKAARIGIKSYEVCDSTTGYLWRFEIHAYKKDPLCRELTSESDPMKASTLAIVLRLTQGLERKGHTLWMDNFYNSPALARKLKSIGFDCVGTIGTNRQFVPQELTNLTLAHMRPGHITGFTSGDVDLLVWRDRNRVAMISTYHGKCVANINGSAKPTVVHDYNVMMGGVDKKDQMLAMYPIERKRTRIWYKKLFRRLLNVSVLNSFIIVKHSNPSMSHRQFRHKLIDSLLSHHHSRPAPSQAVVPSSRPVFLTKDHHIRAYPFFPNGKSRKRLNCFVCKKRSHTYCKGCNKPFCHFPCFVTYHGGTADD